MLQTGALLSPITHKSLLAQLVRREILGRYQGSILGLGWSFLTPLMMLAVYSFVFVGIFKARWPGFEAGGGSAFAIRVFCGLIIFNFVTEILNRSPVVITEQPNLVKKVVFPLEILPVSTVCSALVHLGLGLLILTIAVLCFNGNLPLATLTLPLVLLPLAITMLGISWGLAALGVYVRDVSPVMAMLSSLLMFLSPVFYALSSVPEIAREWIILLPTTPAIENTRRIFFDGLWPDWPPLLMQLTLALLIAFAGAAFFSFARRGFADVL